MVQLSPAVPHEPPPPPDEVQTPALEHNNEPSQSIDSSQVSPSPREPDGYLSKRLLQPLANTDEMPTQHTTTKRDMNSLTGLWGPSEAKDRGREREREAERLLERRGKEVHALIERAELTLGLVDLP